MASGGGKKVLGLASSLVGFITDYLLVFIYIFFLINYRSKFRWFILKLFSKEHQKEVKEVIQKTTKVGQQYLLGKLILIVCLSVLYSIGLGISGVNNFILVSIIAAFLTLIPFLGNLIGMFLAIAFGFVIDGEMSVLIGILITFTVVQFLESYVFEPFVVGDKVDVQPFFVILAIILGNLVWGVIGMVLAVPVLGILNILFNHIEPLKPLGYLFSNEKKKSKKEETS
jgi:predicted PurR-regulated permease PerM